MRGGLGTEPGGQVVIVVGPGRKPGGPREKEGRAEGVPWRPDG